MRSIELVCRCVSLCVVVSLLDCEWWYLLSAKRAFVQLGICLLYPPPTLLLGGCLLFHCPLFVEYGEKRKLNTQSGGLLSVMV